MDYLVDQYLEKIGRGTVIEEMMKARAIDPNYDAKENEAFKESLKKIEFIEL